MQAESAAQVAPEARVVQAELAAQVAPEARVAQANPEGLAEQETGLAAAQIVPAPCLPVGPAVVTVLADVMYRPVVVMAPTKALLAEAITAGGLHGPAVPGDPAAWEAPVEEAAVAGEVAAVEEGAEAAEGVEGAGNEMQPID